MNNILNQHINTHLRYTHVNLTISPIFLISSFPTTTINFVTYSLNTKLEPNESGQECASEESRLFVHACFFQLKTWLRPYSFEEDVEVNC